jgi:hypothetical protein
MKFVFLESGDSLEFKPNPAKIITSWFNYQFDSGGAVFIVADSKLELIETHIRELNRCIDLGNEFIADITEEKFKIKNSLDFDQTWLTQCHKDWAFITDKYKNQIFPAPQYWHDINHLIHKLEAPYSINFKINHQTQDILPEKYIVPVEPGDGEYTNNGLVLSYYNLGRPQYEQWLLNSDIDNETNNYQSIPLRFEYHCSMPTGPSENIGSSAPPEYIKWCTDRNIPVIAPSIPLGKFINLDKYEIRKIMHRNLLKGPSVGFEL